ncbi:MULTISPECIES: DNA-3-methyladenine glycosylase family protein [unclassified Sedimentibacter]|uniref:DNA-3-methyladenine glycosylase family protein n=1 Tax=unclassified Sedimentibacter TaxID=2649220 RepID=UPI0027DFCB68|nr:DNA glycosylase [Sedimentibacter sp. MB35-C1]WMJ76414.1 DNA glycosylase [Sedimentibacter sp. MB35-C1]
MNIDYKKNKLILSDVRDFNIKHIFECGQCFRWNREEDGTYTGVIQNKVINVEQNDSDVIINNVTESDIDLIEEYFDLKTDYAEIKKRVDTDEIMSEAIKFGYGIRILNQDEWETMVSFMISANNRIPMIKKVIENLSAAFGNYIGNYRGRDYFSFPDAEQLSKAEVEKIQECKAGFRSPRIKEAAERFLNERDIVYNIKNTSYDEGLAYLKTYAGIGDKVANCVLLFSMRQFDTFPVDVWVRRVMQTLYVDKTTKDVDIRKFAENKFGEFSGYAQQYLFFYARENGIGK